MTPVSKEDLTLDTGGFLDQTAGDVVGAKFEIASGKYADQVMLDKDAKLPVVLTLTIVSPDLDKPAEQSFSVGSSEVWEIIGGGKAIRNIKDPEKHTLRMGSMAGTLVEHMIAAAGDGDIHKGAELFMARGYYLTDAAFYTGFVWYWEVKEIRRDIGGREVVSRSPLPTKCLEERR